MSWKGELRGAANATAASLPFVLSFGFIAYGALGPAAARIGLTASLVAIVVGGVLAPLIARSSLPAASPSSSSALILGGAVLALLRDGAPALGAQTLPALLAATGAIVLGGGLVMIALGLLGAGDWVRYIPRPVLAGFMNGVAGLIVLAQLPPLLGLPPGLWATQGPLAVTAWHAPAVVVASLTAALMVALRRRWPAAPAPLIAMALAGAAAAAWQAFGADVSLQRVGAFEAGMPAVDTLRPWFARPSADLLVSRLGTIATSAAVLGLIGSMESVLNVATMDQVTGERTDPNRELVAVGVSNVASGLLGGLPLIYLRLRAMAIHAGGGRTRIAVWASTALLAGVITLGLPLIARLPTAVVAGIAVVVAWDLVDRWTRELAARWWAGDRGRELRWNLATVLAVGATTLASGFVAGVFVGMVLSTVALVGALNRQLLRQRFRAGRFASRRVYPPAIEAQLQPLRDRFEVLELEGALFFGSAERLAKAVERLDDDVTELIVDLRRVTAVDASGAVTLDRIAQRLRARGVRVRLSGLRADDERGAALAACGLRLAFADGDAAGHIPAHPDIDRAIEAAERRAIESNALGPVRGRVSLAECDLCQGLDAAEVAQLAARVRPRHLAKGERLFAQGDPGDALYLLVDGSVSVTGRERGQRFASFSPGMCFGETAALDRGGRTADAVADEDATVLELSERDLWALAREHPRLAAQLYRNLARHLSQRLRAAAGGWREAAQ